MKKLCVSSIVLVLIMSLTSLTYGFEFGALTVFGCNNSGTQDGHARWNTGPADGCWDIFMYEGDIAKMG